MVLFRKKKVIKSNYQSTKNVIRDLLLSGSIFRKPLIACVEKQLIAQHLHAMLQKGK